MATIKNLNRAYLLEVFAALNLGFLAVDIYVAHAVNAFAHRVEWVPFYFSIVSAMCLLPGLLGKRPLLGAGRWLGLAIGVGSIVVGLAGLYFHLESRVFKELTLASMVYTAPFVAPLAYTGIGFLLLLNRMVDRLDVEWGRWVVLMAAGGFAGNFALSVLDHAQNGFFLWQEWIPVVTAAFGFTFLAMLCVRPKDEALQRWTHWVMAMQLLVGILGFGYHLFANLDGPAEVVRDNFIFGAPIFAPLLFANLALLGSLGAWDLQMKVAPPN